MPASRRSARTTKLKSVELADIAESWIGAADLAGNLLADEEKLGDFKCKGIEIV